MSFFRELAGQIAEQFRLVGRSISLRECVVVGGTDMVTQGKLLATTTCGLCASNLP